MRVNRSLNRYRHSTKTRPTLPYLRGWAGASVISVKTALPTQGHPAGNTLPRASNPKPAGGEHSMLRAEHAVALRSLCGDLGGSVLQLAGGQQDMGWPGLEARAARLICTHVTPPHHGYYRLTPPHHGYYWLTPPHHGYYWLTPHHGYWHSTNPFQETKIQQRLFCFFLFCETTTYFCESELDSFNVRTGGKGWVGGGCGDGEVEQTACQCLPKFHVRCCCFVVVVVVVVLTVLVNECTDWMFSRSRLLTVRVLVACFLLPLVWSASRCH